jgi:copper chaperone for superoxide dismutase/copper chaperone
MVQVSTSPVLLLMDLTISFPEFATMTTASPPPSTATAPSYDVYVARTGDVTSPPTTTGPVHLPLATITPDPRTGYADAFIELPIGLWDIVGRAMVVEPTEGVRRRQRLAEAKGRVEQAEREVQGVIGSKGRLGILAGVIARSAGAWGNEVSRRWDNPWSCCLILIPSYVSQKTVCACSGKTMWEEGRMMESKSRI